MAVPLSNDLNKLALEPHVVFEETRMERYESQTTFYSKTKDHSILQGKGMIFFNPIINL